MTTDDWNIKPLINSILLSYYYHAISMNKDQVSAAGHISSVHLFTPERLHGN
ncbi:MAG: hypothetical protein ACJAR6_001073 [Oleispira sp.]|jgi:hypothetical protein